MATTSLLRRSPLAVPAAAVAAEVAAVGLLHRLGTVPALRPPVVHPDAWDAWLRAGNPYDVLAAAVRLVALAGAWWLLASTLLYWLAAAARNPSAARALGRVTLPAIRRCIDGMLVASLAGALAGGRTGVAWALNPPPPPAGQASGQLGPSGSAPSVIIPVDPDRGILFPPGVGRPLPGPAAAVQQQVVSGGTLAPTLPPPPSPPSPPPAAIPPSPSEAAVEPPKASEGGRELEPPEASEPPGVPAGLGDARTGSAACGTGPAAEATPPPGAAAGSGPDVRPVRVVQAGDSLWSIAAHEMGAAGDPAAPPSARAVAPYWLRVVEANRRSIASGDPDRIRPGEQVTLPTRPEPAP